MFSRFFAVFLFFISLCCAGISPAETRTVANQSQLQAALGDRSVDIILLEAGSYQPINVGRTVTLQAKHLDEWIRYFDEFRNQAKVQVYILRNSTVMQQFYAKARSLLPYFQETGSGLAGTIDIRGASNVHVRGVYIENFDTNGVRSDFQCAGTTVEYSVMKSPRGNQGVLMHSVANARVTDSFFADIDGNRPHCIYFSESDANNAVAAGNICMNIGGHAIQVNAEDPNGGSRRSLNAAIVDNIILDSHALINLCGSVGGLIANNLAINVTKGMDIGQFANCVASTGNRVLHNIIIATNNVQTSFASGNTAAHNIFLGSNPPQPCENVSSGCAKWGNISQTSLFMNPSVGDFRAKPGSIGIDAAASSVVTDDLLGVSRPQGRGPDMGSFELSLAGPTPTPTPTQPTAATPTPTPTSSVATPTPTPTVTPTATPTATATPEAVIESLTINGQTAEENAESDEADVRARTKYWRSIYGTVRLTSPVRQGIVRISVSSSDESIMHVVYDPVFVRRRSSRGRIKLRVRLPSCEQTQATLTVQLGSSSRSIVVKLIPKGWRCR